MREIEFKAWDYENECEREVYHFEYMFDESGKQIIKVYESWIDFEDGRGHSCHLRQYTGLKDKNEVKIFEGDIVVTKRRILHHYEQTITCEIVFNQGCFQCRGTFHEIPNLTITKQTQNVPLFDFYEVEVIGNIYEDRIEDNQIIPMKKPSKTMFEDFKSIR